MIKKWDAATTTRFVKEYAKHTCLWDVNNENYKSRAARDAAVQDIVNNMGMDDLYPNDVKCKIRIIRNTYINEMKKIREKKRLVGGKHVNYVCNIPWFSTADQFLRKVVRKKKFPANLVSLDADDECDFETHTYVDKQEPQNDFVSIAYQDYANQPIKEESLAHSETEESRYSLEDELAMTETDPFFSTPTIDDTHGISKKRTYEVETTLDYADEFDIFARNVGVQLKQLPLENALQMQAKIHQLLIDERLKVIRQNKRNGLIIENGDDSDN